MTGSDTSAAASALRTIEREFGANYTEVQHAA